MQDCIVTKLVWETAEKGHIQQTLIFMWETCMPSDSVHIAKMQIYLYT